VAVKDSYPYLRDPRAIFEIRKHQWIESEKAGREIGFGTAAIDWITKYGKAWEKAHAMDIKDRSILFEQRKYRRFILETFATLVYNDAVFSVRTIDVSLAGMLCKTRELLDVGSRVAIHWPFDPDRKRGPDFEGAVERISRYNDAVGEYTMLIKFNENTCKKIENLEFLNLNNRQML